MEKGRSHEIQAGPEPKYDHRTIMKGGEEQESGSELASCIMPIS